MFSPDVLRTAVVVFFMLLYMMFFVRIFLSWFNIGRDNKLVEILYSFTEPILAPIRKILYRSPLGGPGMVLDFSPLIAFMLLKLIESFILSLI